MIQLSTKKIALLVLTIGLLTGFLAGVFFQRQIGIGHMLERMGLRNNKLMHHELSPRFQSLRNRGIPEGSIVFVGDSLVDLQEWNEVFPGMDTVNRGVSGATVPDLTDAFDYRPAKAVFCLVGANNIGKGTSVAEFAEQYERLLESVNNDCNFHAIAIPPFFSYGSRSMDRDAVSRYNKIIHKLAESKDHTFIGTGATTDWERRDFEGDGLHLSADGYRKLAKYLKPFLEAARANTRH